MKIEIVSKSTEILGEGPTWDSRTGRIYWIDIKGQLFRYYDTSNGEINTIKTDGMISSIVPSKSGKMYATIGHGLYSIDPGTGKETLLAEIEKGIKNNRFNDGKVDPYGNYWAGTMDMDEKNPTGSLYVYMKNGKMKNVLTSLTISNGLAWDVKKIKFYHIDTPTKKVNAYAYDDKCELKYMNVAVDFKNEEGFPDGMNIDSEGKLWIAHWAGHRISRWDPDSKKKIDEVILPAKNITSCVFGGKNLDKLYVTSAKLTENQDPDPDDLGGSLFVIDTGIKGSETYQFDDSNL